MTFMEAFLREMEMEAESTRKILALVPADKADWKPHAKSMSMRQLATHVAEIPGWVTITVHTSELDMAKEPYNPKQLNSAAELLAEYNKHVDEARAALQSSNDSILSDTWTMRNGDAIYFALSKQDVIRHALCQQVHHRAQLGVYLRLLDIPLPGVYGPSADDAGKF